MTTSDPTDRSTTPAAASVDRSVPVVPPAVPAASAGTESSTDPASTVSESSSAAVDSAAVVESSAAGDSSAAVESRAAATAEATPGPSGRPVRRHAQPEERTARSSRGVYLVPALLVVALVLLVVGLVTATSAWLAASLAASVLAAVLLVVERLVQRRRAAATVTPATDPPAATDPAVVDLDAPAIDPDDPEAVWVVDGRPRYHVRGCETIRSLPGEPIPRAQALEDGFVACSLCEPGTTDRAQHGR